ncbi:MAG: hypothetical protein ABSG51_07900 [Terracidiphilus sp.]
MARRTLLVAMLVAGSCALWAQAGQSDQPSSPPAGQMEHRRPNAEWELARLTDALSLTPDQQSQVKALLQQRHEKMQALRADGTRPTREQMMGVRKETDAKISALLTDEQKAKFAAVRQQMEHDRGGNGHGTPPPPPPPSA